MTEKEQLEQIKQELSSIIEELSPKLNELFIIKELLKDLIRICEGKEPDYKLNT
jgi:hypothetical protein